MLRTGGAGFAFPASIASLMIFSTFFAIITGGGTRDDDRRSAVVSAAGAIRLDELAAEWTA